MAFYAEFPDVEVPEFLDQILPDIAGPHNEWHHDSLMHHLYNPSSWVEMKSGYMLLVITGDEECKHRGRYFEISVEGCTIGAYSPEQAEKYIKRIASYLETHTMDQMTDDKMRKLCFAGQTLFEKYLKKEIK